MRKLALCSLGLILILGLGFIVVCGGFCRRLNYFYVIDSGGFGLSGSSFHPYIVPRFTSGGEVRNVVPFLYRKNTSPWQNPEIVVVTDPGSSYKSYLDKREMVLETLIVKNEKGETFTLVSEADPRFLSLVDFHESYGSESIGKVQGERLNITASGYVDTSEGLREKFAIAENWTEKRVSRFGLTIQFGE